MLTYFSWKDQLLLLLPLLLERVGVRLLEASREEKFYGEKQKALTHKGAKHTKLHKEIRCFCLSLSFWRGSG